MPKKSYADWGRIERLYRAGVLSVLEISRETGAPESTIRLRAKENGWKRDLTEEVRARTRVKLVENLAKRHLDDLQKEDKNVTDEEILEEAARTQVNVVRDHQKTLGQGHSLTLRMLDELDAETTHKGELAELIKSNVNPKQVAGIMKAVSLGSRAAVMRDLAQAARTWVTLERQAFSIADDKQRDNDPMKLNEKTSEELRREILQEASELGFDLSTKALQKGVALPHANGSSANGRAKH